MSAPDEPASVHASAVAIEGRGVLIVGPSGSGKSALAADLISRSATLIADDRTLILPGSPPLLSAPSRTSGMIELHGIGILHVANVTTAPAALIVDLGSEARERLPDLGERLLLNCPVRLMFAKGHPTLAAAVTLAATATWIDPKTHFVE